MENRMDKLMVGGIVAVLGVLYVALYGAVLACIIAVAYYTLRFLGVL
jgi:hypothetical protein